ncbi:Uncharacterised protein [Serratia marcescens]|uniref:hypothetical protein n=1 Tax=Serratia marcescens TaxID=615 RepID=UPI000745259B|nr:hypothetical protein [Serratia marcescens]CVB33244.1 Uncharacterised protein [Serratia marcescens]CVE34256.1 Uncharacterised protein [Serratia marcescens]CVE67321.1 Uncharacterised protein [Serratia marcescens]CVF14143.1 Uncharacterised protein [Serratia marcescens]
MDIETHNLSAELALWQRHDDAGQRDQFEAAATHGYSDEAIEVFTHIDGTASDTLQQRQRELYSWYCDNVKAVARERFNYGN